MDYLGVQFLYARYLGKKNNRKNLLSFSFNIIYLISHLLRRTVSSSTAQERVALANEHAIFQLGTMITFAGKIWVAERAAWPLGLFLFLLLLLLDAVTNSVPRYLLLQ